MKSFMSVWLKHMEEKLCCEMRMERRRGQTVQSLERATEK